MGQGGNDILRKISIFLYATIWWIIDVLYASPELISSPRDLVPAMFQPLSFQPSTCKLVAFAKGCLLIFVFSFLVLRYSSPPSCVSVLHIHFMLVSPLLYSNFYLFLLLSLHPFPSTYSFCNFACIHLPFTFSCLFRRESNNSSKVQVGVQRI